MAEKYWINSILCLKEYLRSGNRVLRLVGEVAPFYTLFRAGKFPRDPKQNLETFLDFLCSLFYVLNPLFDLLFSLGKAWEEVALTGYEDVRDIAQAVILQERKDEHEESVVKGLRKICHENRHDDF